MTDTRLDEHHRSLELLELRGGVYEVYVAEELRTAAVALEAEIVHDLAGRLALSGALRVVLPQVGDGLAARKTAYWDYHGVSSLVSSAIALLHGRPGLPVMIRLRALLASHVGDDELAVVLEERLARLAVDRGERAADRQPGRVGLAHGTAAYSGDAD